MLSVAALASNRLVIGGPMGGNGGFVGVIDDVAIWNTVRSAAEIAADFAGGASDDADADLGGALGVRRAERHDGDRQLGQRQRRRARRRPGDRGADAHGALSFDGGDHVDVADSASLALTGSSTVEVRFKIDPAATGWTTLVQKSTDGVGSNRTYALWVNQRHGPAAGGYAGRRRPAVLEHGRRRGADRAVVRARQRDRPGYGRGAAVPERDGVGPHRRRRVGARRPRRWRRTGW